MPRPAEPKLDRQNLEQCPVERKLRRNSMRFPTIQALLSRFALQRRNLSRHQQEHRKRPACRQALPASCAGIRRCGGKLCFKLVG